MNTIKSFGLVGLAAAALLAFPALATPTTCTLGNGGTGMGSPICINPNGGDGPGSSLQDKLNGITQAGTPDVNVYTGQTSPSAYWSVGATGASENTKMFQLTSNSDMTFGIFDPTNSQNVVELFTANAGTGWSSRLQNNGSGGYTVTYFNAGGGYEGQSTAQFGDNNLFGYYINFGTTTYFSDPGLNKGDHPHMVTIGGNNSTKLCISGPTSCGLFQSGEYILGWEDGAWGSSDEDYQDFVVMVESVHPVPEPAALGVFGLGMLLIGGFVALRRRREGLV